MNPILWGDLCKQIMYIYIYISIRYRYVIIYIDIIYICPYIQLLAMRYTFTSTPGTYFFALTRAFKKITFRCPATANAMGCCPTRHGRQGVAQVWEGSR